jgi:FkbM family methyltransferase
MYEAFDRFAERSPVVANWLGVVTRRDYFDPSFAYAEFGLPSANQDLLEWHGLLGALEAAQGSFSMIEAGAGYGRWTVNGAVAARLLGLRTHLIAVEAEPTHYGWLKQHLRDNRVRARTVRAAISREGNPVEFSTGNPAAWYGQAIADGTWSPEHTYQVKGVKLSSLLARRPAWDFVHMDIQGMEADALEEAAAELPRVRRLTVGTHGSDVEQRIRELCESLGFECVSDYPAFGVGVPMPWGGTLDLVDGVQTWVGS